MTYLRFGYYDKLTIGFALIIALDCDVSNAAAQTDKYPRMAAIGECLMEKTAEIQLARSAAPDSISRDATILVLGRQGYETAVEGRNGFVCLVERGWMAAFDWPEFWNPKVRAADCLIPRLQFDITDRFSTQQDGDGRSFPGGDPIVNQSGVCKPTTAGPRERRDGLDDVEIGLSARLATLCGLRVPIVLPGACCSVFQRARPRCRQAPSRRA